MEITREDSQLLDELEAATCRLIKMYSGTFRLIADKEAVEKQKSYQRGLANYLETLEFLSIDVDLFSRLIIDNDFKEDLHKFLSNQITVQRIRYNKSML